MSESLRAMLQRRGLRLQRERGQNFLTDAGLADQLARLAGVEEGDHVVEVGTGLGVLTRALCKRAERVTTVEIDSGLVKALREEELLAPNVELLHADALRLDWPELLAGLGPRVRVVANLPYSAATPLLRILIELRESVQDWSVMVQREVARRCVARCGEDDYGSLAVLHALTVDAQVQQELSPGSFFPSPKVHSSFLRVWPRRTPLLRPGELAWVERVIRAAFSKRRKTILNTLRGGGFVAREDRGVLEEVLSSVGIKPSSRAETVTPESLLALARALKERPETVVG
ncbi:MAG: 16S rRNA (adenine(1518)-N(6)/adenine(1519)-N(6))-dimethyltransferase RsmA [Myxococcota bacterium]|nr:16S rRNA (adenine(1518)-N(6)/adenine(1519)-N(6))-dimethyltransferase RsmA [Myxococcota bacterium]